LGRFVDLAAAAFGGGRIRLRRFQPTAERHGSVVGCRCSKLVSSPAVQPQAVDLGGSPQAAKFLNGASAGDRGAAAMGPAMRKSRGPATEMGSVAGPPEAEEKNKKASGQHGGGRSRSGGGGPGHA